EVDEKVVSGVCAFSIAIDSAPPHIGVLDEPVADVGKRRGHPLDGIGLLSFGLAVHQRCDRIARAHGRSNSRVRSMLRSARGLKFSMRFVESPTTSSGLQVRFTVERVYQRRIWSSQISRLVRTIEATSPAGLNAGRSKSGSLPSPPAGGASSLLDATQPS